MYAYLSMYTYTNHTFETCHIDHYGFGHSFPLAQRLDSPPIIDRPTRIAKFTYGTYLTRYTNLSYYIHYTYFNKFTKLPISNWNNKRKSSREATEVQEYRAGFVQLSRYSLSASLRWASSRSSSARTVARRWWVCELCADASSSPRRWSRSFAPTWRNRRTRCL